MSGELLPRLGKYLQRVLGYWDSLRVARAAGACARKSKKECTDFGCGVAHGSWLRGGEWDAELSGGAGHGLSANARITGARDRPVKGAPLRGRAELALDRPTRRLGDGYEEMG